MRLVYCENFLWDGMGVIEGYIYWFSVQGVFWGCFDDSLVGNLGKIVIFPVFVLSLVHELITWFQRFRCSYRSLRRSGPARFIGDFGADIVGYCCIAVFGGNSIYRISRFQRISIQVISVNGFCW